MDPLQLRKLGEQLLVLHVHSRLEVDSLQPRESAHHSLAHLLGVVVPEEVDRQRPNDAVQELRRGQQLDQVRQIQVLENLLQNALNSSIEEGCEFGVRRVLYDFAINEVLYYLSKLVHRALLYNSPPGNVRAKPPARFVFGSV